MCAQRLQEPSLQASGKSGVLAPQMGFELLLGEFHANLRVPTPEPHGPAVRRQIRSRTSNHAGSRSASSCAGFSGNDDSHHYAPVRLRAYGEGLRPALPGGPSPPQPSPRHPAAVPSRPPQPAPTAPSPPFRPFPCRRRGPLVPIRDRRRAARCEPQRGDAPVAAREPDPEARAGAAESVRRQRRAPRRPASATGAGGAVRQRCSSRNREAVSVGGRACGGGAA